MVEGLGNGETCGEALLRQQREREQEWHDNKSATLRAFFYETMADEIRQAIEQNRSIRAKPVPREIRHLFTGPLDSKDLMDFQKPGSEFRAEWDEIMDWLREQDLELALGGRVPDSSMKPWADYAWLGSVRTKVPTPVVIETPEEPSGGLGDFLYRTRFIYGSAFVVLAIFIYFFTIGY